VDQNLFAVINKIKEKDAHSVPIPYRGLKPSIRKILGRKDELKLFDR
jgi:hypothetical protein